MELLLGLYRTLGVRQRTRTFMIIAASVVLIASGLIWGRLLLTSGSLADQRSTLTREFASAEPGAPTLTALAETGVITVGGVEYGDPVLAQQADLIFTQSGRIENPSGMADIMVRAKYPTWAPRWLLEQPRTTALLGLVSTGFLMLVIFTGSTLAFCLTAAGALAGFGLARVFGGADLAWAVVAMVLLTFAYLLLSKVVMAVLDRPNRVLAVAHTVVKEATRTGIPLVFVILLLVILPLIPIGLDPENPLRFRIQTFLSRSIGFSYYFAACLTLFLACATVAFEIRDRQIWSIVSKPLSRGGYLLGKWIGILAVNFVLMTVASLSIFSYIQYQRQMPVASGIEGQEDLQQIREAILVAREGKDPDRIPLTNEQIRARVDEIISRDSELALADEVPIEIRRELAIGILEEHDRMQRSVPPQRALKLTFSNLPTDAAPDEMLTLRYQFHILRDDEHQTYNAMFRFNEDNRYVVQRTYVPTMTQVLTVPAVWVKENGELTVEVQNEFSGFRMEDGSIIGNLNWDPGDFEVLYRVSTFEANFVRAMMVNFVKLSFLAMLGITCATFLSFPIACMTAFTVFIGGTMGPFMANALEYYAPVPADMVNWRDAGQVIAWTAQSSIRAVALATVWLLESFGEVQPAQLLVQGRLISWSAVWASVARIGILWSGLVLLVGWGVMRRRQLAIYSGQG
ncbi:MAG: hypothetical protein AB8G96_12785 [Phycisphaerales bacterium]